MKTLLSSGAGLLLLVFLFTAQTNFSSCKKDTVTIHDTTTVHDTTVVIDTVPPTPLTKTQILTLHTWEVGELWQITQFGVTAHYIRGGENTTGSNQDIQRFTFNADGTGIFIDASGTTYSMAWQFITPDEKNMQAIMTSPTFTKTFLWSLVSISENEILITTPETTVLVSAKLIPVP